MEKPQESIEDVMAFVSRKLIKLRKQKGYSSHETFAHDYEFARMQYWRIERGKTNITMNTLLRLLSIHQISIKDFFSDFGEGNTTD